jgi:hypothetical protein
MKYRPTLSDAGNPANRIGELLPGNFPVALGSDGVLHPCWTDFRGSSGVMAPNQNPFETA